MDFERQIRGCTVDTLASVRVTTVMIQNPVEESSVPIIAPCRYFFVNKVNGQDRSFRYPGPKDG